MRLFVFLLNILVGSSLLAQSTEILAASVDSKANEKNQQREHATRLRGKSKGTKMLRLQNPGDVWERIRSGMQIARPSPVQTLPDLVLAKNNSLSETSIIQTRLHTRIGLHPSAITSLDTGISPELGLQRHALDQKKYLHTQKSGCR